MNTPPTDDIWQIRDSIEKLAAVKDDIIAFLNAREELPDSTKSMWIADAKEAYYNVVAAWQMLNAAVKDRSYTDSCQNFLEIAKSRQAQSVSELISFAEESALQLASALRKTGEMCRSEIAAALQPFLDQTEIPRTAVPVIQLSDQAIQLPCSVCGRVAVTFTIGRPQREQEQKLLYKGITKATSLPLKAAEKIFIWLQQENIFQVHSFVTQFPVLEDGIDAYCPDCHKIYCREHYNVSEVWDEGFYDYAYGLCPVGHKRIIDD